MIILGHLYDGFNDVWEAATAPAALLQGMIDLRRDYELPRVSIEEFNDSILDLFLGDDIAVTDQHRVMKQLFRSHARN
jgi:hypothetical protein